MTLPTFPPTSTPAPQTGGAQGYLRIATEEAFATPEIIKEWLALLDDPEFDDPGFRSLWSFYGTATAERPRFILEHLQDLDDKRIKAMDDAGIDKAILSLTSPGAQPLRTDLAKAMATLPMTSSRRRSSVTRTATPDSLRSPRRTPGTPRGRSSGATPSASTA